MREALARGWLVAWTLWGGVPVGALVLLLVHAVTGGRWGAALAPVLRPAALLVPLVALGFLGVAAALPVLYPWAVDPTATAADVARAYLAPGPFLARAALALLGWSVLALLAGLGRLTPLAAGLGLAFYGLTISLVAVDWLLSIEPRYTSSAFATAMALQQMLSSLALVALVGPQTLVEARARDLSGLLLALLLGVLYLDLMAFVVAWYGDLPAKAAWYGRRGADGWGFVVATACLVGGALPFAALLLDRVRASRRALRPVGALILVGVALRVAWFVLPAYPEGAGGAALAGAGWLAVLVASSLLALRLARRFAPVEGALRRAG